MYDCGVECLSILESTRGRVPTVGPGACIPGALGSTPSSRSIQSMGGKARAVQLRESSRISYYANPKRCLECGAVLQLGNRKVGVVRRNQYCNHSCAARSTNRRRITDPNWKPSLAARLCQCGCKKSRGSETCLKCRKAMLPVLDVKTKSQLFTARKNWQSARSSIQTHARRMYINSGMPKECRICGYSRCFEVAHLKPVSAFEESASVVKDINAIGNLVALCPNHHWEFDNGYLLAEDITAGRASAQLGLISLAAPDQHRLPLPIQPQQKGAVERRAGTRIKGTQTAPAHSFGVIAMNPATRPDQSSRPAA